MSFDEIAARMRQRVAQDDTSESASKNFEELHLLRARILGVLIRDARETAGKSLESCAACVGVSPETLEAWEFGKTMPSLPELELIAYCLEVPISHFWNSDSSLQRETRETIDKGEFTTVRNRLIGAVLRSAREERGLTAEELAGQTGTTASNINAYELGQRAIPVPVLSSLASACHVNLSYFLENASRIGTYLSAQEDMKKFSELPEDVRRFVSMPVNQPYLDLAMKLAKMGSDELRGIAEAILDITL